MNEDGEEVSVDEDDDYDSIEDYYDNEALNYERQGGDDSNYLEDHMSDREYEG